MKISDEPNPIRLNLKSIPTCNIGGRYLLHVARGWRRISSSLLPLQVDRGGGGADAADDVRRALHLGHQQRLQQPQHRPRQLWQRRIQTGRGELYFSSSIIPLDPDSGLVLLKLNPL